MALLTERWKMVRGSFDKTKPWLTGFIGYPQDIQIKMYGSKRYKNHGAKTCVEFFSIADGVRITVNYEDLAKLIEEWQNADPAEEYENNQNGEPEE